MVTGIRKDAWANANRIPVAGTKPVEDHGRYLHPELFGGEPLTERQTPGPTSDRDSLGIARVIVRRSLTA
jgi:hypothetical protein